MLRSFHAELQKAHRRHDLLLCLLVPLIMILWVGGLAPSDPEELANGYSALLYSIPVIEAILMPVLMAVLASRLWEIEANGITDVRIEHISGKLTDHFDPQAKVIRLSDEVYGVASIAAVGVAAHEAGHAVQYATDYAPIRIRAAIIPATRIGSNLSWPLLIAGLIFNWTALVWAGILLFGLVTVFQLATLPVEFNASRRALAAIESRNLLTDDELRGARSVLRAAAMTYVAALLVSFAQLLRLILLYGNRRRD